MISIQNSTKISSKNLLLFFLTILLILKTVFILNFVTSGDFEVYKFLYNVAELNDVDFGYHEYISKINSMEVGHYIVIWLFSNIGVDWLYYTLISNVVFLVLLVNALSRFGYKWQYLLPLSVVNIYTDVLYFSAERLRLSLIFLLIAVILRSKIGVSMLFLLFGIITHVQLVLIIIPVIIMYGLPEMFQREVLKIKNVLFYIVAFLIFLNIFPQISEHGISKIVGHFHDNGLNIPYKTGVLSALMIFASDRRLKATISALCLCAISFIVGDGRVNLIVFFMAIHAMVKSVKWEPMAWVLIFYGLIQSVRFGLNIINFGTGFTEDGKI